MNQKSIEDKINLTNRQLLIEVLLLCISALAIYSLAALVTFDPADPSWSQTAWHEPIKNIAGYAGATLADILLFTFGNIAYSIPFIILLLCFQTGRHFYFKPEESISYFSLSLIVLGVIAFIFSSCALSAMNIDDLYYYASGGVIGSLLASVMLPVFSFVGSTLILLCFWAISITLLTGCSWLFIAEKIGALVVMCISPLLSLVTKKQSIEPIAQCNDIEEDLIKTDELIDDKNDETQLALTFEEHPLEEPVNYSIDRDFPPLYINGELRFIEPSTSHDNSVDEGVTSDDNEIKIDFDEASKFDNALEQSQSFIEQPVIIAEEAPYLLDEEDEEIIEVTRTLPPVDSLIHPLLMRNEQNIAKPKTPLPTLNLLTAPAKNDMPVDVAFLKLTAERIEKALLDYRVKATVVGYFQGPVITLYEIDLAPGVKAARISALSQDLARALAVTAVRVVEVIPGKRYVGLELPNNHRQTVYIREVLDCPAFREAKSPLTVVLGKDTAGQPVIAELGKMPHLLVAGTTGSGKSVGVNAMILSILYKAKPEDVRFIMIDPKMLELSVYEGIPHLLTEVVTDMKDAANALRWCVGEMERRYKLMSALGVRNLAGYNDCIKQADEMGRPIPDPFWKPGNSMDMTHPVLEKLPYIVVMVDEFADLIMAVGKKVEELIARLAQKARAAGIHLVLATQRPSVDVITGLIKANIPTRIAFTVSSKIDSRTILDRSGAESLLGMGDMLYLAPNSSIPIRIHGAFVRDEEVHAVAQDWKARGRPQYLDGITASVDENESSEGSDDDEELDPLFDQVVAFVVEKQRVSISSVQRQLRIGYNRAARIVEQMEAQGIVSSPGHNGNREVLAPPSMHESDF